MVTQTKVNTLTANTMTIDDLAKIVDYQGQTISEQIQGILEILEEMNTGGSQD